MSDTATAADTHNPYATYWIAWAVLLLITLVMLALSNPFVLLLGITIKAVIICFWFMHLKSEAWDLTLTVIVGAFVTAFLLFGLIASDGLAM
jgi:hypothetical protein